MTQTVEAHMMEIGHKCKNPYNIPAKYIKAGEMMSFYNWTLYYHKSAKMYRITNGKDKAYDFTNFNCACAKLQELGKAHASNQLDCVMGK